MIAILYAIKECEKCTKKSLDLTHEEADLRIIFHLNLLTNPANVVIRTSNADFWIMH